MATFRIYLWLNLVAKDSVMECTNHNLTWNYNVYSIFSKLVYFSKCVLGSNGGTAHADKIHNMNKYTYKIKYMTWKGSSLKDGAIYTSDLRLLYSQLLNDGLPPPPHPILSSTPAGGPFRISTEAFVCVSILPLSSAPHHTGSTSQDRRQPVDSIPRAC